MAAKMPNGSNFQLIEDCEVIHENLYKFYASVMILIFILALPLNGSVLHLFIFKLKFWNSNTNNVFLFNLVLADILLLFCLPIKSYNFIMGERRSTDDVMCKAMLFMLFLNRGASIAFLTVTSINRYFNVVHPGRKTLLRSLKKSPQISVLIWLILFLFTIPTMMKNFECCNNFGSNDENASTNKTKEDALVRDPEDFLREMIFFTQILIPFFILVYCTVRIVSRLRMKTVGNMTKLRRAVILVTTVMVVFSFCFLPCTIARMILLVVRVQEMSEHIQDKATAIFDGLVVLSYMDCLLDPLVYCFSSTNFKNLYLSTYLPFLVRTPPKIESSTGNTTQPSRNRVV
ncbi:Hydroxycarboxylic acid receptor 2 [Oryzias melastigma]|uniref:Hydroxycarboxylic acid receptor 2 n=1 Tax=Oryzias melastigma TaxID=30732 RepID=A0A3B3CDM7_ORYME|nr:hydroxycarboxylic acid receptor 2 [Oryzias melastigma]KAF6723149.1 Hydroxycarboxylic acid receptor 2 [Oryzias melastigma]